MNIVNIAVGLLIGALVLPVAMDSWFSADTTTWGVVADIWPLVPLFAVLAVAIFYSKGVSSGKGSAA